MSVFYQSHSGTISMINFLIYKSARLFGFFEQANIALLKQ